MPSRILKREDREYSSAKGSVTNKLPIFDDRGAFSCTLYSESSKTKGAIACGTGVGGKDARRARLHGSTHGVLSDKQPCPTMLFS